jgi:predicted outer membrane repeat protein
MKAIKLLPIILPLFMMAEAKAQTVRYVNAAATGTHTGTSWATAYNDLQSAFTAATAGDTIWVAKGTYYPTLIAGSGSDVRDKTFFLKSGVKYFGGFAGTEVAFSNRDSSKILTTNVTILSGDIGTVGDSTDNAYHVVLGVGVGTATAFDGFKIMNGNANGTGVNVLGVKSIDRRNGGGIYLESSGLLLKNLMLTNNNAIIAGAGMHNRMGTASLNTVTFYNNFIFSSDPFSGGGAGMSNDSGYAILNNVTFYRNNILGALGGAGLKNNASGGSYTNVVFANNYISGGDGGGAIYNADSSNPVMNNVQFNSNTASNQGGAMYNDYSKPVLNNVTFYKNFGNSGTGAMENDGGSDAVLNNVVFRENKTSGNGGAVQNWKSNPTFNNVTFINNYAIGDGGAMYNYTDCSPKLTDVIIDSNRADGNGGGIYNKRNSNPIITNTLIVRNSAGMSAGGVYTQAYTGSTYPCSPIFTNVTIANNNAAVSGGGLFDDNAGGTQLRNCIVQGNIAPSAIDIYAPTTFIASTVHYSIVGNKYYVLGTGAGTTLTGTTFIDTTTNDFRLKAGSPAINMGDSTYFNPAGTPDLSAIVTDIRTADRIMSTNIDLGSYETCADTLKPTIHIVASPDTAVAGGTSVTFTATATILGATPTYVWKKNGVVIAGASGSTYTAIAGTNYKNGDTISVFLYSSSICALVDTASSNRLKMLVKATGISTIELDEKEISLFPNPNEGTFTIDGIFVGATRYYISITDVTGREVYNESFFAPANNMAGTYHTKKEVTLNSNNPGIYFLSISAANQPRQVLRFVIK